ncbi:MAG: hypothetical protein ACRYFX_26650 [Janthinobacterium lividum]
MTKKQLIVQQDNAATIKKGATVVPAKQLLARRRCPGEDGGASNRSSAQPRRALGGVGALGSNRSSAGALGQQPEPRTAAPGAGGAGALEQQL